MNEENNLVKFYVINENTGYIVRHEIVNTDEELEKLVNRYYTAGYVVVTSIDDNAYCFYIKGEVYTFIKNSTSAGVELIEFFKDTLAGLYDNARDAFHIEKGRVATMLAIYSIKGIDGGTVDVILSCLDNIWRTRYYSRFLRRGKNE